MAKLFLDWHADQAETYPWEEDRPGVFSSLLVRREPVGVVGAIVPWNFPLGLTMPKLCPALLTGCTVVLKPAEETPLYAFLLAEIFEQAGLPPGVLNVVPADRTVSEELVRHPLVDKISFTGSTRAGSRVGSICGEQIKRCALELGGKSAAIILDDADLDEVIPELAPATMRNSGQACINQTRVLAPRGRYEAVVEALAATIGAFVVGDPADPDTVVGPLISEAQRERVEGYIASGRRAGARLVVGGGRPSEHERGYFVEPTIFADVDNRMTIAQEEIFGPVVAVIPYTGEDEAVAIANDSAYGLSGSVWSGDAERALRVARRLRTGNVGLNQPHARHRRAVRRLQALRAGPGVRAGGDRRVRRAAAADRAAASAGRLVASPDVLEQRARRPVQRGHDLVAVEAVVVVQHEPRAPGADVAEHRLGAARLVRRQVARHLGHRRRDRVAARLFQLVVRQRPEHVRVLVEEAAHLGTRPPGRAPSAGRPSARRP